jgi:hypothetical protein
LELALRNPLTYRTVSLVLEGTGRHRHAHSDRGRTQLPNDVIVWRVTPETLRPAQSDEDGSGSTCTG